MLFPAMVETYAILSLLISILAVTCDPGLDHRKRKAAEIKKRSARVYDWIR